MSDRFEELFSPERLQRRWQNKADTSAADRLSEKSEKPLTIPGGLEQLRQIIGRQYPGNGNIALCYLADRLEELLKSRFPESEGKSVSEEDRSALNIAIEQILCQIEDLSEALDMGKKEKLRAG